MAIEKTEEKKAEQKVEEKNVTDLPLDVTDPKIKELIEKAVKEQLSGTAPKDGEDSSVMKELTSAIKGMQRVQQAQLDPLYSELTYVREEDIDHDDILSDADVVTFFCHNVGYVIVDTKIQGQPVRAPYGKPIVFKYQSSKVVKEGRAEGINNFSTYRCTSKKILTFLKSHPLYNIVFFDKNHQENMSSNATFASKLIKIANKVNGFDTKRIADQCRDFGIPVSESREQMVNELAIRYAEQEMKTEIDKTKIIHSELEQSILGSKVGRRV